MIPTVGVYEIDKKRPVGKVKCFILARNPSRTIIFIEMQEICAIMINEEMWAVPQNNNIS